jgi:hypothetical protein
MVIRMRLAGLTERPLVLLWKVAPAAGLPISSVAVAARLLLVDPLSGS